MCDSAACVLQSNSSSTSHNPTFYNGSKNTTSPLGTPVDFQMADGQFDECVKNAQHILYF